MTNAPEFLDPTHPWAAELEESKREIVNGEVVPLMPILDRLRAAAERLEAELGVSPDGPPPARR